MSAPPDRPRVAVALVAAALAFTVSYTAQRALANPPVDPTLVVHQVHIPYLWRSALALLHGVSLGLIVGAVADDAAAARALPALPRLIGLVGLPCVAALAWLQ